MSDLTSLADIRPDHLEIVQNILQEHLPDGFKVWVFGSRANWTTKDSSDLDLAVEGADALDYKSMVRLEVAFEESDLPYTVDVVDLNAVSPEFKRIVEKQRAPLPIAKDPMCINKQWREDTFAQVLAEPVRNGVYKKKEFRGSGVKIVNMGELFAYPRLRDVEMRRVQLSDSEQQRFDVQAGDLLFARRSLVAEGAGKCSVVLEVNEPTGFESSIIRGRPDPTIVDSLFLYYYFNSPQGLHALDTIRRQVAVAGITGKDLAQLTIPVPPLPEQQRIAHTLGTLDDKIELNRQMNQTLEEMARAIFQDWFVDFGPVRANLECREPYLPPELWDLFPDRLVDSELGEIPDGWEAKALVDCLDVARGLSYKGSGLSSYGIPMHNLNSIYEGGGYKDDGIKFYNGDFQERHVTQPGDVLVANTEQGHDKLLIGFAAIVPQRFGDNGLFSHHIYRVRPKGSCSLSSDFVCQLLNTKATHDTVSGYATGTTVNMLPVDALRIPGIVVPLARLVTSFSAVANTVRSRQEELIGESRSLAALRDALLPKLVSGAVRSG